MTVPKKWDMYQKTVETVRQLEQAIEKFPCGAISIEIGSKDWQAMVAVFSPGVIDHNTHMHLLKKGYMGSIWGKPVYVNRKMIYGHHVIRWSEGEDPKKNVRSRMICYNGNVIRTMSDGNCGNPECAIIEVHES